VQWQLAIVLALGYAHVSVLWHAVVGGSSNGQVVFPSASVTTQAQCADEQAQVTGSFVVDAPKSPPWYVHRALPAVHADAGTGTACGHAAASP
jgi:hypothetical protein